MSEHGIFDDAGEVSASVHWDKCERGVRIEFFEKEGGMVLSKVFVHFEGPGTSFNVRKFTVGNDVDLHLEFIVKVIREKRANIGEEGRGGVQFWMFFEEPSDLSNVGGFSCVEIKAKAEFLKEREDEWVMLNGVEANGGTEGGVDCAKVGGWGWIRKALKKFTFVWEGSSRGERCFLGHLFKWEDGKGWVDLLHPSED